MSNLDGQVEYDMDEIKANFNAMLYLLTENMAVSLEILKRLKGLEVLTEEHTNEILSVTGDRDELTRVYNEVFTRFIGYYQSVQRMIQEERFDTPAENSANTTEEEQYPQGHIFPKEDCNPATDPMNQPENIDEP